MYALSFALQPGATTQFTNYPFNSMVKFGNTYLGASSEGIYLLDGSDDNGVEIEAYFEPITTDFGSDNPKRMRFIYLGYEAQGDLELTLKADDKATETVVLEAESTKIGQQRRRVPATRELQGRYWNLQVKNMDGCDFAVDSIDVRMVTRSQGITRG